MSETVKIWLNELSENGTDIQKEIEDVKGTISNERLFAKGSRDGEEAEMHFQNIAELEEYLECLEEMARTA